jgi:nitroimidazol reductase NimA-like FMN-containing flavoprotein (pyridoxamine 5'-phosphate oxidase superfamily)
VVIHEMSKDECLQWMHGVRLGRLACANKNQPYIIPVYLAFHRPPNDELDFYGFTTPGLKVEWMRTNPLVCVEMDEIEHDNKWLSIVALGHYEELPDDVTGKDFAGNYERQMAYQVLQARATWWEPAVTIHAQKNPAQPSVPIFYKIRIDNLTGHRATS